MRPVVNRGGGSGKEASPTALYGPYFSPRHSGFGVSRSQGVAPPTFLTAGVPSQTVRLRIRKSPTGLAALNTRCSHGRESVGGVHNHGIITVN